MLTNSIHYFAGGNTAQGFVDYFASNLQGLDRIFILKGGPGTGKSTLMKSIEKTCEERGLTCEVIHCTSDPESYDGVIVPKLKFAVVDGTAPHIIEPSAPGAIEDYVNLGTAWDSNMLKAHKDEILSIKEKIGLCYENTYKYFADALQIHDEWEKIYIKNMNFNKADKLTKETVDLVLKEYYFAKKPVSKHRFFGGSTPMGSIDYVESITANISKRYLLKGRPGSGKSTLLKKLASDALERGIDADIYHCGFDSFSLDMVLFPELDVCVFDSTAPHLYEPLRQSDEIIDMYARCINPGTDQKYERQIQGISARYKIAIQAGIKQLSDAKRLHDEMEKFYIDAIDFSIIDEMKGKIIEELTQLAES